MLTLIGRTGILPVLLHHKTGRIGYNIDQDFAIFIIVQENHLRNSLIKMPTRFEPLITSVKCQDIDELVEVARHWKEDYLQLGTGSLRTMIDIVQFGSIQLGLQQWNLSIRACGESPSKTITIGIPLDSQGEIIWYGRSISQGDILLSRPDEEHYLTSINETKILVISIDQETLIREANKIHCPELESFIRGKINLINPSPVRVMAVRNYLQDLLQLVRIYPKKAINSDMQKLIHQDFIPLILNLIASDMNPKKTLFTNSVSKRFTLVKKAEEFIESHLDQPLTLRDLYQHLQVSERTLRYSFQDCLGISPMTYLKIQRLHGVRRELKSGHSSGMKINQIATRWGFWHMGQFSQDYKKLFGEFPSQTLIIHNS